VGARELQEVIHLGGLRSNLEGEGLGPVLLVGRQVSHLVADILEGVVLVLLVGLIRSHLR